MLLKKVRQSPEPSLSPKGRRPPFAARFVALGSHDVWQCMEGSSVQRGCAAPLEWLFGRSCRSYHMITVLLARIGAPRMTKFRARGLSYTQISLIAFASFARPRHWSSFPQTWCVCQAKLDEGKASVSARSLRLCAERGVL